MDEIILSLDPQGTSSRGIRIQAILFGLVGLSNLVQAFFSDNKFRLVNLIGGAVFVSYAIVYPIILRPKVATFNEDGVMLDLKRRSNLVLAWNQIAYIEASTLHFHIHTKNSEKFTIDLGNLTYAQHKTLKPRIIDLAHSHGVDVRVI